MGIMISIGCYQENGKWKSNDCYCYILCPLSVRFPRLFYLYLHLYYLCVLKSFPYFSPTFHGSPLPFPHRNVFPCAANHPILISILAFIFSYLRSYLYLLYSPTVRKKCRVRPCPFGAPAAGGSPSHLLSIWGFLGELLSCSSSQ